MKTAPETRVRFSRSGFRNALRGQRKMAHPDVASSNALFDILADWEDQLKHCEGIEDALKKAESLAHDVPEVSP